MKKLFIFILLFSVNTYASCFKDVPEPNNQAKLTYYFFDLYELAYHQSDSEKQLSLSYLRDIKKEHSMEGWNTGLKDNIKDKKTLSYVKSQVKKFTGNMKEGDCLKFVVNADKGKVFLNKRLVYEYEDKLLAQYIFAPWLGKKPVSDSVKETLLGKK